MGHLMMVGGRMRRVAAVAVLAALSASAAASAQAYNIDFGNPGSAPPSSYAAAGIAGPWNVLGVPTPGTYYPLVNVQGVNQGVTLNNSGGTNLLVSNDPATSGPDEALMDDMLIGFNNPVDICLWVNNLPNGPYEVRIYAMTPNAPTLMSRTRVDNATEGPTFVGGAWPGHHVLGITYSKFHVTVTDGTIGFHSGLYDGNLQSGVNGVQIRKLTPGDLDGDGAVTGSDLGLLLAKWGACADCPADLNGDGTVDGGDLGILLAHWTP